MGPKSRYHHNSIYVSTTPIGYRALPYGIVQAFNFTTWSLNAITSPVSTTTPIYYRIALLKSSQFFRSCNSLQPNQFHQKPYRPQCPERSHRRRPRIPGTMGGPWKPHLRHPYHIQCQKRVCACYLLYS